MLKKVFLLTVLMTILLPFANAKEVEKGIEVKHDEAGIYVFKIDTKIYGKKIKPVVDFKTPSELHKENGYKLVVNGGFFDPFTQEAVSFVVIDKKTVDSPFHNLGLIDTLINDGRIENVINRAELRILENSFGKIKFDIANHFDAPLKGYDIKHSIQGGPELIPDYDIAREGFIKLNDKAKISYDAVDILKRRPRTVVGLKKNDLYIIIFTKNNKIAVNEAIDVCKKLKLEKAMALDGGGSTAISYKDINIFSEGNTGRKVRSFLVIEN